MLSAEQIRAALAKAQASYVEAVFSTLDTIEEPGERLQAAQEAVQIAFGRDRDQLASVTPFGLDSLVGSYFRVYDQDDVDEPLIEEGQVMSQVHTTPTTAIYLVEFYGRRGATGHQQLVDLDKMLAQKWSFYDTEAWLRVADQPVDQKAEV